MRPELLKVEKRICFFFLVLLVISYLPLFFIPAETESKVGLTRFITVNKFWEPLVIFSVGWAFVTLIISIWVLVRRQRLGWFLLAAALTTPFAFCIGTFKNIDKHTDYSSLRDKDGSEYHLMVSHFLQGSDIVICRLLRESPFTQEYEVLVTSAWEEMQGSLGLVRPQGTPNKDISLYMSPKHVLVGATGNNRAFLAYDLSNKVGYSGDDKMFEPARSIYELSPFLLLTAKDTPNESDFKDLLGAENFGRPKFKSIEGDLKSENPAVRKMAGEIKADILGHPTPDGFP